MIVASATRGTANLNLPLHIVPGNDYFFEVRRLELTTYSARLTITADKQQNKTTTSQSSSSSPTSNSNSNTSPPKPLNPLPTSTKISIAIGTITGILILALTIFIFLSRRRKAATKRVLKNDGNDEFGFTKKSEMDGQGIAKNTQMVELAGKEFKVVEISGVEVWGELGVEPVEMEARERPRELGVEVGKEVLTLGKGCG
ncbi:hypothetical protein B0J11DRAFT_31670 [Dendryphion nanum]|uniref:Uncharacterized protein n=1 Tax=Dendryphion nanum TaxID=256645 RepID=A0A9P9J2H5_9PLEO|nr:hypothetical protein B0J11DRAFT_31670 [Dendryphion nanum]